MGVIDQANPHARELEPQIATEPFVRALGTGADTAMFGVAR